ncbi:MAG: hypothetical protein A2452_05695 [Candidatus Firestonebacteria bacterium RIFOXYC2_FULL_39_67]|nr:MAG: hypothetical protein A2536_11770 [Candidatus Firestonebacteria bacterium RIFOXYD2_FULL_39_29]OGF56568.1 MAG: hypothetical protein A2452_05695 [Candidatus Firestonebacteria bacterium RIFOXYC2_FULL_39_67]OGF58067.1 MAG: hypothetical protein A2497_05545 [Candidatus Firestonebacteria bacterium RifOxyC12_full_39_7]
MKKIFVCLFCGIIFAGCSGTAKAVKATAPVVKYNIGISENIDGDGASLNITEMVIKELISYSQVKFVDRRKLKNKISEKAALLAEGSSDNIQLEDPMQYIMTGSVIPLGSKKIVRLSILNVQTSITESSVTFDYERLEGVQDKVKTAAAELMRPFSGQTGK